MPADREWVDPETLLRYRIVRKHSTGERVLQGLWKQPTRWQNEIVSTANRAARDWFRSVVEGSEGDDHG